MIAEGSTEVVFSRFPRGSESVIVIDSVETEAGLSRGMGTV